MTALLLLAFCVVCLMHSQSWFMVSEIYGIYISYYSSPSHPKVYLLSLTFPPLAITLSQVAWLLRTFCPDIAGIWILMQFCCFPPTMASLQRLSSRGRGAENRGEKSVVAYLYIHISLIYIHVCQYAEHVTTQRILSCEACQRRCSALIKPTSHFTAPLIRPPPPDPHPPLTHHLNANVNELLLLPFAFPPTPCACCAHKKKNIHLTNQIIAIDVEF